MTKSQIIIKKIINFLNHQLTEKRYCVGYQIAKQEQGYKLNVSITNNRGSENTRLTVYADSPSECMDELTYLCKTYYYIDFTFPIMHRESIAPITNQIGKYAISGQYICKSL